MGVFMKPDSPFLVGLLREHWLSKTAVLLIPVLAFGIFAALINPRLMRSPGHQDFFDRSHRAFSDDDALSNSDNVDDGGRHDDRGGGDDTTSGIFNINDYELSFSSLIDRGNISDASGATMGPNRTIWIVTDHIEQGGRVHQIATDGSRLRSIKILFNADSEDIAYLGDGFWAIASEDRDEGVHVFEMADDIEDQAVISEVFYHATVHGGESLVYDPATNKMHLVNNKTYSVVTFDKVTKRFTETPGIFNPDDFSFNGGNGATLHDGIFFWINSRSGGTVIRELDITTPQAELGNPDDRLISAFEIAVQSGDNNPKIEGIVWLSKDSFMLVGEGGFSGPADSLMIFTKVAQR